MSETDKSSMVEAEIKSEAPFLVYAAGSLFSQHELTSNVLLKKAVWEFSAGKFQFILPQSKELRDLDRPDLAEYIRNVDLSHVFRADLILARFDGMELDSGTVIEYALGKFLGKPTVILRTDPRILAEDSLDAPYNLMVKNWPRTVEVHLDSLINYSSLLSGPQKIREDSEDDEGMLQAEIFAISQGIEILAKKIIEGLEAALLMKSPYPEAYQELAYKIARLSPGNGFGEIISERNILEIIQRLKGKGTL